jgi:hypothetical protein
MYSIPDNTLLESLLPPVKTQMGSSNLLDQLDVIVVPSDMKIMGATQADHAEWLKENIFSVPLTTIFTITTV